MAEGDKWLLETSHRVSLALRAGKRGRPVDTASSAIRAFATSELRALSRADAIASVEDYLANAAGDLVCLGLWLIVTDTRPGDALPLFCFARDDRMLRAFSDRIEQVSEYAKLPKLLRTQIEATLRILSLRQVGFRERLTRLAAELDDPA